MNLEQYKKRLENSINDYKKSERLALEIEPIIHSFKGKQLNKRLAVDYNLGGK